MRRLVCRIVSALEGNKLILAEQREEYEYALYCMAQEAMIVGIILLISCFWGRFLPTAGFLLFFLLLRGRSGGYHASSDVRCLFESLAVYLLIVLCGGFFVEHIWLLLGVLAAAVIIILLIGSVNHPNMNMDSAEYCCAKRLARRCALLQTVGIVCLLYAGIDRMLVSYLAMAVILCAGSMLAAKITGQEIKV